MEGATRKNAWRNCTLFSSGREEGAFAIFAPTGTIISLHSAFESIILDESSLARMRDPFHSLRHSPQQQLARLRTFRGGSSYAGIPKGSGSSLSGEHRLAPIFGARVRGSAKLSRRKRRQQQTPQTSGFKSMSIAAIRILLEFVTGPERPIIQIAPWFGLLQKLSREKNPVVSLEP